VKPSASAEEIKSAFRRLAKTLHPDVSTDANAKAKFQAANEAYEVLSDANARAGYDSLGYEQESAEEEVRAPEPVKCSRCGNVTAQPRYAIYRSVVSVLVTTVRNPIQGIFCAACGRQTALKASLISAVAGWWAVPWGPIYTVAEIYRNANGGRQPPGAKERLLWTNALAFLGLGQLKLSYALAREVRKTANEEIGDAASKLMEFLRGRGIKDVPPLQDSWRFSFGNLAIHLGLLAALPLALFIALQYSQTGTGSLPANPFDSYGPPPATSVVSTPPESYAPSTVIPATAALATCARPPGNGAVLQDNVSWSVKSNALEIHNGGGGDAIIKIRDVTTGGLLVSFLVQKDATATYSNIPDGQYRIQYGFGGSLAEDCTSFTKLTGAGEFPAPNEFTTTNDGFYIRTTILSFTLYTVPNGNVRPATIDAAQFNTN